MATKPNFDAAGRMKERLSALVRCYPAGARNGLDTQCRELTVRYWIDAQGR